MMYKKELQYEFIALSMIEVKQIYLKLSSETCYNWNNKEMSFHTFACFSSTQTQDQQNVYKRVNIIISLNF